MLCPLCGNKDENFFFNGHKGIYCRKCINFKRVLLQEDLEPLEYEINENVNDYHFDYSLTKYQKEISDKCALFIKKSDVLLNCVCGAVKTEILVKSISEALEKRHKSVMP